MKSFSQVLIAAASNIGQRTADTIAFPARHPNVIAVGSCDNLGNRCGHSAVGADLAFLFPGDKIQSASSQYRLYGEARRYAEGSGTSFAAPHCAALVGIILAMIEKWRGAYFLSSGGAREMITSSAISKQSHKDYQSKAYVTRNDNIGDKICDKIGHCYSLNSVRSERNQGGSRSWAKFYINKS